MTMAVADGQLNRFRALVEQRLGLLVEPGGLMDVLARRSAGAGVDAYLDRLQAGPARADAAALASDLTIPESYFFRNLDQFNALREAVLPERLQRHPRRMVRILSAGCASGEEAHSIAIIARELNLAAAEREVSITAVDANPVVIERARRGRYSAWALRETPPDIRRRWFQAQGSEYQLDERARSLVAFEQCNLVDADDPWDHQRYDIVFCRNVLMYLSPAKARTVVRRIFNALAEGGFLFLGHAETLRGLSEDFLLRHTHGAFYYQRKPGAAAAPCDRTPGWARSDAGAPATLDEPGWIEEISRSVDRVRSLALGARGHVPPPARRPAPPPEMAPALDLIGRDLFVQALAWVDGLPVSSRCDPDVLLLRAMLLVNNGEMASAEAACRRLLEIDGANAGAHHILGLCREAAGEDRAAADEHLAAAFLDPEFAMPRLHLGLLARRAGGRDAARRELRQALLLLRREDTGRLLLFGGGFTRLALMDLCRAELDACERDP